MRWFNIFSSVALPACCVRAGMSDTLESPFAITFTQTTVIASRYNASGSVELTKQPLSLEYQEYYRDAVRHFDAHNESDEPRETKSSTEFMFHDAVVPVTESLSRQLGYTPEYAAFFVPSIFGLTDIRAAAKGVLGDFGERPARPGRSRDATCHGFGFLEGRNLGRAPEEYVDEGPLNLIVVLEYEKDYLYAWLMEVEFELQVYPRLLNDICEECGERYSRVSHFRYSYFSMSAQANAGFRILARKHTENELTRFSIFSLRRLCRNINATASEQ